MPSGPTCTSSPKRRSVSGTTAPSSRISLRAEVSRDRFCSAPAAEPHTAADGVRSMSGVTSTPAAARRQRLTGLSGMLVLGILDC